MIGNAIRVWRWAALLQLLCATAVTCAQAQPTAAGTDAQKSASPPSHGSYLGSQLIPHTGPDIRGKSATGTDTDHRLLLVIGVTKKVAAVTDVCGNGAQSSQRRVWQGHFRKLRLEANAAAGAPEDSGARLPHVEVSLIRGARARIPGVIFRDADAWATRWPGATWATFFWMRQEMGQISDFPITY